MASKQRQSGFTIIEMLTVVVIIAILVGLLVPTVNTVRNMARTAKQKAQFASIDMAITAFKTDYGDYPPTFLPHDNTMPAWNGSPYTTSQMLAEAILGQDLMGFHPDSDWTDAMVESGGAYNFDGLSENEIQQNLDRRSGPYLDTSQANAFRIGDLFVENWGNLNPDTFVLCDVFGVRRLFIGDKTVKAGTPILYFKANAISKKMDSVEPTNSIYNIYQNANLISLGPVKPDGSESDILHPLLDNWGTLFYSAGGYKVIDPKITGRPWPHRPDSYILISAGPDGLFGNSDDITNFGE